MGLKILRTLRSIDDWLEPETRSIQDTLHTFPLETHKIPKGLVLIVVSVSLKYSTT